MKPIDEQGPILSDDPDDPWSLENLNRQLSQSIKTVIPAMRENPESGAMRLLLGRSDKQKAKDRKVRALTTATGVPVDLKEPQGERSLYKTPTVKDIDEEIKRAAPVDYEIIEPEVTPRPIPVLHDWKYYQTPIKLPPLERKCPEPSPSRLSRLLTTLRTIWTKISNRGNST